MCGVVGAWAGSAYSSHSQISANGRPYRKRTSVADRVPSSLVSERCAELRTVCASAANITTGTHSQDSSIRWEAAVETADMERTPKRVRKA